MSCAIYPVMSIGLVTGAMGGLLSTSQNSFIEHSGFALGVTEHAAVSILSGTGGIVGLFWGALAVRSFEYLYRSVATGSLVVIPDEKLPGWDGVTRVAAVMVALAVSFDAYSYSSYVLAPHNISKQHNAALEITTPVNRISVRPALKNIPTVMMVPRLAA